MIRRSAYSWRKLQALAVAIDAAAQREPYPRLAQLMDTLAPRPTDLRADSSRSPPV